MKKGEQQMGAVEADAVRECGCWWWWREKGEAAQAEGKRESRLTLLSTLSHKRAISQSLAVTRTHSPVAARL